MPKGRKRRVVEPCENAPVIAREFTAPPDAMNMLERFPHSVYQVLTEQHFCDLEVKALRLVSKQCRSSIDSTITALTPRGFSGLQVSFRELLMTTFASA